MNNNTAHIDGILKDMKKLALGLLALSFVLPFAPQAEAQVVVVVHHHRHRHCYWKHHHRHCYYR